MSRVLPRGAATTPYEPNANRFQHECGELAAKVGTGRRQRIVCPKCHVPEGVSRADRRRA